LSKKQGGNTNTLRGLLYQCYQKIPPIYFICFLLLLIFMAIFPPFRSIMNLSDILRQLAPVGMVCIGQTFAILLKELDLSVGAVVSLATALTATIVGVNIFFILIVLAIGLGIGLSNGAIISKLKVPSLITTLGMMAVINGIALVVLPLPGGYVPTALTTFINYGIADIIPVSFLIFLLAAGGSCIFLTHTSSGRYIYATGANEEKARIAGIDVNSVKMKAFAITGFMASVGGILLAARMYSGAPRAGEPYTLNSIAAVLIGGTTFAGGRGGVEGTIAGAFLIVSTVLF